MKTADQINGPQVGKIDPITGEDPCARRLTMNPFDKLRAERDELKAALKEAVDALEKRLSVFGTSTLRDWEIMRDKAVTRCKPLLEESK